MDSTNTSEVKIAEARQKLDALKLENGCDEPDRGDLDVENIEWRYGRKPDYTLSNLYFLEGKCKNHSEGSIERIAENLVKTWEMEATHKINAEQWTAADRGLRISCNGGRYITAEDLIKRGSYNSLMSEVPKELYDAESETFESSHLKFRSTFPRGFGWEVLEVFSGPPVVSFSWRHFANFEGTYKDRKGNGKLVEMFGFAVAKITENLKLYDVEIYFKPEEFLRKLEENIKDE